MSLSKKGIRKGSITAEAAVVLPFFLYGMIGILYLIPIFSTQTTVQKALKDTANTISLYGYFNEDVKTIAGIQIDFYANLNKEKRKNSCISGGIISLARSYYENDDIVLIADYQIKIPVPLLNLRGILVCQTVKTRKFVGWDRRKETDGFEIGEEEQRYVFIAENGEVYHLRESCTHLDLSIKEILVEELVSQRNKYERIYHSCLLCVKGSSLQNRTTVFITLEGERYHYDFNCSGLKRTVRKVPFSSVSDWRKCSRCG